MTNTHQPLDTRALNGVLGVIRFLWTLIFWSFATLGLLMIPTWFVFAWIEDPAFATVCLLSLGFLAFIWEYTKRPPRKRAR